MYATAREMQMKIAEMAKAVSRSARAGEPDHWYSDSAVLVLILPFAACLLAGGISWGWPHPMSTT